MIKKTRMVTPMIMTGSHKIRLPIKRNRLFTAPPFPWWGRLPLIDKGISAAAQQFPSRVGPTFSRKRAQAQALPILL